MNCPKCGAQNEDNTIFCNVCGALLSSLRPPGGLPKYRYAETKSSSNRALPLTIIILILLIVVAVVYFLLFIQPKAVPVASCGDRSCAANENCITCASDCGACPFALACGDTNCSSIENCSSCPSDCGPCVTIPICGDTSCNGFENCTSCPEDCEACPVSSCGDGNCSSAENCSTCAEDCGNCSFTPSCGDRRCTLPETCSSCLIDCGPCTPSCGDSVCTLPENCSTCSADCGNCTAATQYTTRGIAPSKSSVSIGGLWNVTFTDSCASYGKGCFLDSLEYQLTANKFTSDTVVPLTCGIVANSTGYCNCSGKAKKLPLSKSKTENRLKVPYSTEACTKEFTSSACRLTNLTMVTRPAPEIYAKGVESGLLSPTNCKVDILIRGTCKCPV